MAFDHQKSIDHHIDLPVIAAISVWRAHPPGRGLRAMARHRPDWAIPAGSASPPLHFSDPVFPFSASEASL